MARWEEVLDLQLQTHNWLTSDAGIQFGQSYFASAYNAPAFEGEGNPSWTSEAEAGTRGEEWAKGLGAIAFNADPVYVEPDMMTLIEGAIDGFVPEPLQATDLITMTGFLVLPRSLWLVDPNGRSLSWKAALWFPTRTRPDAQVSADVLTDEGPMESANGIHLTLLHDTQDRDDMDSDELARYYKTRLLPTHVVNWYFGGMHPGMLTSGEDVEAMTAHRQLQAIWRLLTQYLSVHERRRVPRDFAKRARKAKLPTEYITIVRLRRPPQEREAGEPTTVHWSHRWLVRGFWRSQPYPSLGIHRQIWISPFVKGPNDLPLVLRKGVVFAFER